MPELVSSAYDNLDTFSDSEVQRDKKYVAKYDATKDNNRF